MRISDRSSDVCSSDLSTLPAPEIPEKRRSWLDRISSMLSGEHSTRDDLVELLRDVQADGLIAADTQKMREGALTVSGLSVGAVMVTRTPKVMLPAEEQHIDMLKHCVAMGQIARESGRVEGGKLVRSSMAA